MILNSIVKKYGFTLAEVLITLGIIGIIAALTIPTLIQKQQEITTISSLKKAYSELSQAYTQAVQDNGTPDNWGLVNVSPDPTGSLNILNIMSPYLKVVKNCGNTDDGCFPNSTYKYLNENPGPNMNTVQRGTAQLADGSLILLESLGSCNAVRGTSVSLQNVCGDFYIDINGFKGPNQYGVDWFSFWITKNGIIPLGTQQETSGTFDGTFDGNCKIKTSARGWSCTAWVIYNGNTDYLKPCGSTLSWNGPTSCN